MLRGRIGNGPGIGSPVPGSGRSPGSGGARAGRSRRGGLCLGSLPEVFALIRGRVSYGAPGALPPRPGYLYDKGGRIDIVSNNSAGRTNPPKTGGVLKSIGRLAQKSTGLQGNFQQNKDSNIPIYRPPTLTRYVAGQLPAEQGFKRYHDLTLALALLRCRATSNRTRIQTAYGARRERCLRPVAG